MRHKFYRLVCSFKHIRLLKIIHSRHYSRTITGDHLIELNEKTLTGRFLNFLDLNRNAGKKEDMKTLDILRNNDINKLKECDTQPILCALSALSNPEQCKNKDDFLTILHILDKEFCNRVDYLEPIEIFKILHTYMNIIPGRIVQHKFYNKAVEKLFNQYTSLTKSDLIQFIFYLSIQKKRARARYMLKTCMNSLNDELVNDLNIEELCIICNSTFKTSTKFINKLVLDKVNSYINENLHILKDPAIFVTLIKTIRHNRSQCEELLATISCTIFFNKIIDCYSFSALCHILALYSDFLYFDHCLTTLFTEKCIELLRNSSYTSKHVHLQEQPRAKDVKRFLWCLSNLNYKNLESQDIRDVIIPNIIKRLENGEFESDPVSLIEINLYLWMLHYYDRELLVSALTAENVRHIRALTGPSKDRLNLLLTSIYFEDRNLFKKIDIHLQTSPDYNMEQQLKKRPLLQKVYENLKSIPIKFEINKYILGCQVPNLNIIGITGYRKKIYKVIHVEVLDEYTCLKNTAEIPSGLMDLKLRIMEKFDEGIIVIRASDVEGMSTEELSNLLEDELDLVC